MNEKHLQITSLVLQIFKILCFALALILFLVPFSVLLESTAYVISGGTRQEITSETDSITLNFFDYIDYLEFQDWPAADETLLVVMVVINLVVAIILLGIDMFLSYKKRTLPKKVNLFLLAVSILPLIAVILSIMIQANSTVWMVLDTKIEYISGYRVIIESCAKSTINLIPTIIASLLAVFAHLIAGLINLKTNKVFPSDASNENNVPQNTDMPIGVEESPMNSTETHTKTNP